MKKTSPCGPDTALILSPPPPPPSNYELGISGNNIPAPGEIRAETAVDTPRQPLDGRGMKNYAVRMTTGNPARRRAHPIRVLGLTWAWGGVDFRPIRRWRRAAAFLVLCASLAAPLLGAGGSAQAAVLVSNFGESASSGVISFSSGGLDLAQVFTTGSNAAGYTLTSIEMPFYTAISAADIGDLSVSVWSVDSSGNPLTKQFDLTNPASIAATTFTVGAVETVTGNYAVFTAPSNTTLTQPTKYAVVLTFDQSRSLWSTASTTETSAATGWSIADNGLEKSSAGSSWSATQSVHSTNFTLLIRVNGEEAANNAPIVENPIPDQVAPVGGFFSYAFFPTTFSDADSDTLSYMATKADDTMLPTWLTFNPAANHRTFSGTPAASDVGVVSVKVTASDGKGGSVSDIFDITVEVDTTPPTLTSATVNSSGGGITLVLSETVSGALSVGPPDSAYTVTADGVALPVASGGNPALLALSFQIVRIRQGQTVVITYTDPTTGNDTLAIQDAAGNDAASFTTGMNSVPAVTNNSTLAAIAPNAPTGLTATASGADTINLSWTAPVDNGGSVITGYKIEVSIDSGTTWTDLVADTASTTTTYEHTGLAASTTRHYRVSAINSIGTGTTPSDVVDTTTGTAANTAPTSANKFVTATEDTDYAFSSADFPFTDTDGDSLSSVKIVTLPTAGTLTLSGTAITSGDLPQTVTAAELTASNLKYAPVANSNLGVTFTFRVNDGTADSAATYTMDIGDLSVNDAPTGQPGITGTAQVGEVLTATAGDIADVDGLYDALFFSVDDATTTVQWIRVDGGNETDIPSATAFTYTLVAADEGKTIKVKVVSFEDVSGFGNGPLTSDAYPSVGTVLPAASTNTAPTSADKTVGTPEDTEYTFSSADFPFTDTDAGATLESVKIVTLPTSGTLTLSGTALTSGDLPQTVTAAGLTASNLKYAPVANSNLGVTFTFRVNDGTDDSVGTNTMTVSVTAVNDAPTGKPGIAGTARVGQVLMATVGTIADPDGLPDPFLTDTSTSFQWVRVTSGTDADISGATASTYTLVDTDNGQKIRVKVSFQDDDGTDEGPFTSDAYPSGATVLPSSTNNPPTSADKVVITDEDTAYTFSSADFPFTDTDMGDTLSSVKIVSLPAPGKGTLTLSGTAITSVVPEQTVTATDLAAGTLKYDPPANESGNSLASFTFRVNDGTDNSATPNTVTVNVTAVNDAVTGKPRIAGAARVGRVLTAAVGTIADPDGLPDPLLTDTNTSFQWVRVDGGNETDISGAMASTYTLVADDNGKTIRVKVSFQDDDGTNEGPLTSDAYPSSGTVLPASTNVAPTSQNNSVDATEETEYTFSSADFVFTDTDGDSLSSVKIVSLPARGTLTLSGTALTSGDLPQTVGAAQIGTLRYIPPANESGTALASFTFRVNDGTDDSVATYTMTVNVTAVNAETLATLMELSLSVGTLVPEFSPTHFRYRVSVAAGVKRITMMYAENAGDMVEFFLVGGSPQPLTDADPGSDTFEVDLSVGINVIRVEVTAGLPSGSVKAKSALEKVYSVSSGGPTALSAEVGKLFTALPETKTYWVTVTVGSSGGFLGSWMARFGRTVADQVLGSVGDRLTAPRTSGTEVRLAGHRLGAVDRDTSDQASGENTARAGTMGTEVEAKAAGKVAREAEKEAERKMAVGLRALTNRLGGDGNNGNYGKSGHDGLFGGFEARAAEQKSRGLTGREMLTSSSFTLTADTAGGDHGALWGRGAVSSFDGRTGGFGLDGEVVSVILGIDRTKGPAVMGVALGHSRGEGAYRSADGEAAHGEIATTLIGIYPYVRYEVNERLSVWGVGGHGMGTMTLTPEGLAPMATNTDLVMAALGGRGVLRQPLDGIGLELAVRSDVLAVRTTTKALRGSGVNLAATAAAVTRLRLGLEGTWHNVLPLGLVPTFEIGVRYDGGDAETGFGADLGSGLTWADPVRGIRAAFHARGLVGHEDDGFQELGLSGLLYWDARPDSDLGWSLGIAQTMGARATGGMDALLNPDTTRVFGFDETVDSADSLPDDDLDRRLAADLGYGFAMFGGRYTGTPAVGLRLSEDGRETVLGWSLAESQKSGLVFGLDVAGRRHESVGGEPGHSFGGGFGWQRAGGRSGEPGFGVRFEGERLAADRDGEPEHRFGVQMTARW